MFDSEQHHLNSKILIVDDDQIIIDVITAHLNVAGFWNIIGINDSIDAVQRIKRETPDLILVDISMPDVSGNFLIQTVREDRVLNQIPIIVVTASCDKDTHQRAIELGANRVMTKPIESRLLIESVSESLKNKFAADFSNQLQRRERNRPANEKYQALRGLGGRI